jgi:muramoyltetrapeptide carboxypeptidase LdcA involved in peptidoglycan recycling
VLTGQTNRVSGYPLWERDSLKDEEHPLEPYHVTEPKHLVVYPQTPKKQEKMTFKGRLLGGCLDCLDTLVGTRFDKVAQFCEKYREDGIIWFIESCDLNPMGIRRALWQLKEAGWFRYVKGFLVGRPLCFGEQMLGLDQYHAVYDILREYSVPIIMDVDLGHLPPSMPIICGAMGLVEVEDAGEGTEISITYQI